MVSAQKRSLIQSLCIVAAIVRIVGALREHALVNLLFGSDVAQISTTASFAEMVVQVSVHSFHHVGPLIADGVDVLLVAIDSNASSSGRYLRRLLLC